MEISIYYYALCVSLTLMLFFSYRFIFGKLPNLDVYRRYRMSRTLMGAALLVLSTNYAVHLFCTPRLTDPAKAILTNLCTYFIVVWLFGSALLTLLDKSMVTRRKFIRHVSGWVIYTAVAVALCQILPPGTPHHALPAVFAVVFLVYAFRVARSVFLTFRKVSKLIDDYCSDDMAAYIQWMSVFTYWAVFFGVGQGIFTFVPDQYVFLWIISAIPFYIYLYVSYANYLLFYEKVEGTLQTVAPSEDETEENSYALPETDTRKQDDPDRTQLIMSHTQEQLIAQSIDEWIERKGFTTGGITIADVARDTGTNRTYLSLFVNKHYHTSFREWVNRLRLDYAKEIMSAHPDMPMAEVAQKAGYLSMSYFTKTFKQSEGITPGKWGKN